MKLSVCKHFSEFPKLRYISLSDNSAEKFYHEVLNENFARVINSGEKLEINIDNTAGYTSSFLDEAFGNLVYDFGLETVKENLAIISNDEPYWLDMIYNETYKEWEERRRQGQPPKKSKNHPAWFKYIDGSLEKKVWINV